MKKIYISGKITGIGYYAARTLFYFASKQLEKAWEVIDPTRSVEQDDEKEWKDYMLECIELLWDCDAIYMLRNYKDSKGANIELAIAIQLGLEILFEDEK